MKKITLLLVSILSFCILKAQKTTSTPIDTLEELKMLLNMIDSLDEPTSFFEVSLGVGNRSFSVNNNAVNASQAQVNKLYYTPSIGYYHKSGFGISITPYLTVDNGSLKNYQTAIIPSYDFKNNWISTGISFTKFITDTKSYTSNSTFQNDLYSYLKYNKTFIEPILSLGYSTGKYNDISFDTIFSPINNRVLGIRKDSTSNEVKDFSLSLGVEHTFNFDSVFTKKGSLSLTPQLVLNAGSEKFTSTITNTRRVANAKKNNRLKSLTQSDNGIFAFQSVALSLTAEYYIGNFVIAPNLYFDYYLPATTEKRFSSVFSFSVGYSF